MFLAQTYGCTIVGHRVCIAIHTVDAFTPDCTISRYLLAFFVYSSLRKPKNSLFYCMQDYKRNYLFALRSKGQRLNANSVETLLICVCASLALQNWQ